LETFTARGESPAFANVVKKKDKDGKKSEERVLAVGKHRVFIFRTSGKVSILQKLENISPYFFSSFLF
jgi:hypothetical protein